MSKEPKAKAKSEAKKTPKAAKAKSEAKRTRAPREVKLTESDERLLEIVKEAKKTGIAVDECAKQFFGARKIAEVSRPNQAIFFKVMAVNKKLKALGAAKLIEKRNPGPGAGKRIELFLEAA